MLLFNGILGIVAVKTHKINLYMKMSGPKPLNNKSYSSIACACIKDSYLALWVIVVDLRSIHIKTI